MPTPLIAPILADREIVKLLMEARSHVEAAAGFARLSGRPVLMTQIEDTLVAGCTDTALSLLPDPVACPADLHELASHGFGKI